MKKVLWVEDEKFIYDQAKKNVLLIAPQHYIHRVENGEEAFKQLNQNKYDILVVDLRINWKPGLANNADFNFIGIEIIKLSLKGEIIIGGDKISIKNVLDPEHIWVLTGYDEKRSEVLEMGILPNQYILKGTERKSKFIERIVEQLNQ